MKALFIGAGATYDCGMPLVWELTAEIRRWMSPEKLTRLNENWKARGCGWSDEVLCSLIGLLENSNLHYENIIGAIEVESLAFVKGSYGSKPVVHERLLMAVLCRSWSQSMPVKSGAIGGQHDANDWSGRMHMGRPVKCNFPVVRRDKYSW